MGKCDYCKTDDSNLHMSRFRYQPNIGSVKVFCSQYCLDAYKEKIVADLEKRKSEKKDIDEQRRLKRELQFEKERKEHEDQRLHKKQELKNNIDIFINFLLKSKSSGVDNQTQKLNQPKKSLSSILWNLIIIIIIICVLISNIFNIDGSDFLKFFLGFH